MMTTELIDMNGSKGMSEQDVEAFLAKLKQADTDKKVDILQLFGLKVEDAGHLPEACFDAITLLISTLLRSTSHLLVISTLTSFLPIYFPLLPITPSTHLRLALTQFLPSLLDRLNDPKERTHTAASSNIAILGRKCYESENIAVSGKGKDKETLAGMWERMVKEGMNKGWRCKVEGMKMLLVMRLEEGSRLPLKPWLGTLVEMLEDGDGNVRDQARETVVALLSPSSTPSAARTELKKLLLARNVRKTIADGIINRIFSSNGIPAISDLPAEETRQERDNVLNGSEEVGGRPATPAQDDVDVVYIASARDLESEFAKMLPYFADKETEHNWSPREKSVFRLRGMLRGHAHQQYLDAFVAGLKAGMMEGIAKTLSSLRTTVAQQSCAVVQELAERLRSSFDPFVENLLPVLGKMAGFTKKVIADKSQRSLLAIITHTTCHPRLLINHITAGMGVKNIQTRHHCTVHLKTFLDTHGSRCRHSIEITHGLLNAIETAIRRALVDVNPMVRDLGRAAFWSFHVVWPSNASVIMSEMDGVAAKQLEKTNPHDANGDVIPPPSRPALPKKASSAMSQMLAEKRKAKAAELAAGGTILESPHTVSSPPPSPPSLPSGIPRSTSASTSANRKVTPSSRSASSQQVSPTSSRSTSTTARKSALSSPKDLLQRSRSSSLARTPSTSPPSAASTPPSRTSSLRRSNTAHDGKQSPSASSVKSVQQALRTPTAVRRTQASNSADQPVGIGIYLSPQASVTIQSNCHQTPEGKIGSVPVTPTQGILDDALRSQAAQAVSAAQQLLDFSDDDPIPSSLLTPMRSSNGNHLKGTIIGNGMYKAWEDSPRSGAMTPAMLDKLRERKHERSWWLKRLQLLEKATPLELDTPTVAKSIEEDMKALASGQAEIRNLQKLSLFSTSHPISLPVGADPKDIAEEKGVWEEDRLFARVFEGLMAFLDPTRPSDILEQALVLLWEMVQHQWVMFEDHDIPLCHTLFSLRATRCSIIIESTNSLISLLCEVSDPLFFLGVLTDALRSYLASHPIGIDHLTANSPSSTRNGDEISGQTLTDEAARASGYLFGLNAMGMGILKLPKQVVEIEGRRLAGLIMDAMSSPTTTTRQAANTLILAIQCVLGDSQTTLALFPELNRGQKDLAIYLMERNGLLSGIRGKGGEDEKGMNMMGEMVQLLGRGVTAA